MITFHVYTTNRTLLTSSRLLADFVSGVNTDVHTYDGVCVYMCVVVSLYGPHTRVCVCEREVSCLESNFF